MIKRIAIILIVTSLLLFAGILLWQRTTAVAPSSTSFIPLLTAEDTAGFARATQPNAIQFPRDLGSHNDYQTEWWYYTGNLEDRNGRQFGYQFTIFRRALKPATSDQSPVASDWQTNQIYLAHFAISDIANNAFYPAERFSRGAAGLAGAQAEPYRVWLEDWQVQEIAPGQVKLQAQTADVALDLTLTETLPPVLHGDNGLSPKGPEPGNASYYYSIVQQQAEGTVRIGADIIPVTGLTWKDHEYSTSALSSGAIGWDWFSLQLDDGTALMFFQIRQADGSLEPYSSGSFIAADGVVTPLSVTDWELEVTATWTSPTNDAEYPAGWRIRIPKLDLQLEGAPLMANQELTVSTTYWEGASAFSGTRGGNPVTAKGYIELTGYAETMEGRL